MLPLEVMGPGGSLSTVLVATPYWRNASWRVSWQAALATAAYSCDWTTTALVHWLGSGWWWQQWSGTVSTATDSKFVFRSSVYLAFFHIRFLIAHIRPVNSASNRSNQPVRIGLLKIYILKCLCRFSRGSCSRFPLNCSFKNVCELLYAPPHPNLA